MYNLVGINDLGDSNPSLLIEDGIIEFFDWGLLGINNFTNVARTDTEGDLQLDNNPNYTLGRVWRCENQNLVWQSGVGANVGTDETYPGISGVYVDAAFYPRNTTGAYAYSLDHINGRVIFDTAISTTAAVTMDYSHKHIDVVGIKDLNHLQEVFEQRSGFSILNSGDYFNDPRATLDLPLIGVEVDERRGFAPYQLGGGQRMNNDVLFHCISSDKEEVNKMKDIVSMQNDRVIRLLDQDKIYNSGVYPIDYNGVPVSGAMRYPELVNNYKHSNTLRMYDTTLDSSSNLSRKTQVKTVRMTVEMNLNIT